jgi:hypothetical protein
VRHAVCAADGAQQAQLIGARRNARSAAWHKRRRRAPSAPRRPTAAEAWAVTVRSARRMLVRAVRLPPQRRSVPVHERTARGARHAASMLTSRSLYRRRTALAVALLDL